MKNNLVFYSRCKPQNSDALRIAIDNNIIFIGYPLWRSGVPYNPNALHSCLVNPEADWDIWDSYRKKARKQTGQYAKNRNLVAEVGTGSIALIPRPESSTVYAATVLSPFEIVDAPPWYSAYMELRGDQDDGDTCHAGDVAQIYRVSDYVELPVWEIPGWIRGSLFGRSTFARIKSDPALGLDPHKELTTLMAVPRNSAPDWTIDPDLVFTRLLKAMTPQTFEHLIVSLLQLENPHLRWMQVGGSGDGGVDGLGFDDSGHLVAVLQCKLRTDNSVARFEGESLGLADNVERIFATLYHPQGIMPEGGIKLLTHNEIVQLTIKHCFRLPQAHAMRIGKATPPLPAPAQAQPASTQGVCD